MTVDCTDCPIAEPVPFSSKWFSYKLKRAGLRYEVAVCIQTGDIVWINGPFKCGRWNDLMIFRRNLKAKLLPDEMVETDRGYQGDPSCRHADIIASMADLIAKKRVALRHETVNSDLKKFECLKLVWSHDRHLHKFAFAAVAVLTQLKYENGEGPKFQCRY